MSSAAKLSARLSPADVLLPGIVDLARAGRQPARLDRSSLLAPPGSPTDRKYVAWALEEGDRDFACLVELVAALLQQGDDPSLSPETKVAAMQASDLLARMLKEDPEDLLSRIRKMRRDNALPLRAETLAMSKREVDRWLRRLMSEER